MNVNHENWFEVETVDLLFCSLVLFWWYEKSSIFDPESISGAIEIYVEAGQVLILCWGQLKFKAKANHSQQ